MVAARSPVSSLHSLHSPQLNVLVVLLFYFDETITFLGLNLIEVTLNFCYPGENQMQNPAKYIAWSCDWYIR